MTQLSIGKTGSLSSQEKRIVKRLIFEGQNNQDIQAFINFGRAATVNFARIASVKNDKKQKMASEDEVKKYRKFKSSYDPKTGLNPYIDERLTRSRDAMKLAVSVFNNPTLTFRTETFTVLATIAWTYLALEFSCRNNLPTERKNGDAISLADFLKQPQCPLTEGVKNNLKSTIKLRDLVEHRLLGDEDPSWIMLFQANCLNYERFLTGQFGDRLSLAKDMSFSLQFSGLSIGQTEVLAKSELASEIESINAEVYAGLTDQQRNDQEFQFSVVYTTVSASKAKAAFKFHSSDSLEGKEISNVLVKFKPSSETHPFLARKVVEEVVKKSGKKFTSHDHTNAWKKFDVRPKTNAADPSKTNVEFCYYNPTYKHYSYSQKWIDRLCDGLKLAK